MGGGGQAVRQAGRQADWAQGSEVNSLAAACSVLTAGAFFMLTFFKRRRLFSVFLDPVYTCFPPPHQEACGCQTISTALAGSKGFKKRPKKQLYSAEIKCSFLSARARVRKRPLVIRGDTERRGLSGGWRCTAFLSTLHIWCELCPRWPFITEWTHNLQTSVKIFLVCIRLSAGRAHDRSSLLRRVARLWHGAVSIISPLAFQTEWINR